MRKLKSGLLLTLAVVLLVIVLQNQAPFQVRFLWLSGQVPGIILLFMTAAAGFIIGISATLMWKSARSK
jgi:uncharacterized integral membrane protein